MITGEALILLAGSILPAHTSAPQAAAGVLAAAIFFGLSLADPIGGYVRRTPKDRTAAAIQKLTL